VPATGAYAAAGTRRGAPASTFRCLVKTIAFPDFQAQDWPTWQRLDRRVAQFALTFEEWQAYAALRLAELANRGCDVRRVVITPEDIVPWRQKYRRVDHAVQAAAFAEAGLAEPHEPYSVWGAYADAAEGREVVDLRALAYSERRRMALLEELLACLAAYHDQGVAVGDLRPELVEYQPDRRIRFCPERSRFLVLRGAQRAHADVYDRDEWVQSLLYASPEALSSTEPTPADDVYSLGMMVFQALAGRRPVGPWDWQCEHCALGALLAGRGWDPYGFVLVPSVYHPSLPRAAFWDGLCYWTTRPPGQRPDSARALQDMIATGFPPLPFPLARVLSRSLRGFVRPGGPDVRFPDRSADIVYRLGLSESDVVCHAASSDASQLITAHDDGIVRVRESCDGRVLWAFPASDVDAVAVSSDGRVACTARGRNVELRYREADASGAMGELASEANAIALSADGTRVVIAEGCDVCVWDARQLQRICRLFGHQAGTSSVTISHDGIRALTVGDDYTSRLWDLQTGQQLAVLPRLKDTLEFAAISLCGRFALTCEQDGTQTVWTAPAAPEEG